MTVLVTGAAGFIGFHLSRALLEAGHDVVGLDALTHYYDPALKQTRLDILRRYPNFAFSVADLAEAGQAEAVVGAAGADVVFHMAAQPGVRYSIENPQSYIQSNIVGTANLLEALRRHPPRHLIFASSSSVYGGNANMPYAETDRADSPLSLYAATKKAGEALVHSYAHLWSIPSTCVRFFTVYGPYGRPDMALLKFARAIVAGEPIDIYGQGRMRRDFTYVDDLIVVLVALMDRIPVMGQPVEGDSLSAAAPFRALNIGGGRPVELMDFVASLERALGRKARLNMLPMQPGDVVATEADTRLLRSLVGELPKTPLDIGIDRFVDWFRDYAGPAK
ncbi:NAD-dependent epimerase/dehydratase family protein [Devosia sediminis]|uniref:NAD-dependent epimerase/dehydratase family protein n=1 Tax=Devosia sediminis TaxID=2798801 RepID=A0A934IXJ9_9HYPH|nr:NAD-dependent epimerase/dehydratase family protein [Devosia sediminis]MBJ3784070.1 NAD-dependent epimerase/dehydratase family protein [Devosia sediminis]